MWVSAQKKIELSLHKPYSTEIRLCDQNKKGDNFLLNLPITFSMIDKNVLLIMIGNDTELDNRQSVWMFSEEMNFARLQRKDRNVRASTTFKKKNPSCNPVLLYHKNMTLQRDFDDGYEIVKKNAKPIFLEIINRSSNQSLRFSLQFYVSKPYNCPYFFVAKCQPVEFELIIKQ
jgi:hypothetical protein